MDAHHDLLARAEQLAAHRERIGDAQDTRTDRPEVGTLDAALRKIEQLEAALEHRSVISEAVGMLMERFGMDAETAFAVLSRISQDTNRKAYDIACELTAARQPQRSRDS